MTHESCESKLRSVVRLSMHPYPGNPMAIGRAVVYYAWAAREFSTGIKCRHCTCLPNKFSASIPNHSAWILTADTFHDLSFFKV